MKPRLLDTLEAAERMNVSRWTIYALVKAGVLRPTRLVKGKFLFTPKAVEEAIAQAEGRELAAAGSAPLRLHSS